MLAAELRPRGPEGTQAAGQQATRAKTQAAPEATQAAGPAGHRPRRAPKEQRGTAAPTVPKDMGRSEGTNGCGSKQPVAPANCQD